MLDTEGATWVTVEPPEAVPVGEARPVVAGTLPLTLANVDGTLHAVTGLCPHRGGPLGGGKLCGADLSCPWHGFKFDVRTGESAMPVGAFVALTTYPVRTSGGAVEVSIPTGPDSPSSQEER